MGLFFSEKEEHGSNYAQSYQNEASKNGNGFFWYGSPAKEVGGSSVFSVKSEDQLDGNEVCIFSGSLSGENGNLYCAKDSFIHLQTQVISPVGIIHSGFYQMPIIGLIAALVFVGVMKWLKLKQRVLTN